EGPAGAAADAGGGREAVLVQGLQAAAGEDGENGPDAYGRRALPPLLLPGARDFHVGDGAGAEEEAGVIPVPEPEVEGVAGAPAFRAALAGKDIDDADGALLVHGAEAARMVGLE